MWIVAATGFFLFFAWLSLPTEAIAWRISHEARKAGYKIAIEDLSISPFGGITLENVVWTFEPSEARPDVPPSSFRLDEVDLDIGLFSLLGGRLDVEIEHEGEDDERIWIEFVQKKASTHYRLELEQWPLYMIPKAQQTFNAPLRGLLSANVDLEVSNEKTAKANGTITLNCSGCGFGDGEEKLYLPGGTGALAGGFPIPSIELGSFGATMIVEEGAAEIEKELEISGEDVDVRLTGGLKLAGKKFERSRFDMVLKVAMSDALLARSDELKFAYDGANPQARLEPPEKGLGWNIEGTLSRPRFRPIKMKSTRERRAERRKEQRERDARHPSRTQKLEEEPKGGNKEEDDKKAEEEARKAEEEAKKAEEEEAKKAEEEPAEEEEAKRDDDAEKPDGQAEAPPHEEPARGEPAEGAEQPEEEPVQAVQVEPANDGE
jgi:type II secretion system protein N